MGLAVGGLLQRTKTLFRQYALSIFERILEEMVFNVSEEKKIQLSHLKIFPTSESEQLLLEVL